MQQMANTEDKKAVLTSEENIAYFNKVKFRPRVTNVAAETLYSLNLCFCLNQKSSLLNEIDNNILRLIDHGFIRKWVHDFVELKYLQEQNEIVREQLEMSQLWVGFMILIGGWIFTVILLILEVMSIRISLIKRILMMLHE